MKHTIEGVEYEMFDTGRNRDCSAYGVNCHFFKPGGDCTERHALCDDKENRRYLVFLTPEQHLKAITNRLLGVPIDQFP